MDDTMNAACIHAAEVLSRIQEFVHAEQRRMAPVDPRAIARDERFMTLTAQAIRTCTQESLNEVLQEIRGLSHYFCSYSPRLMDLDPLLDELFVAIQDAIAEQGGT